METLIFSKEQLLRLQNENEKYDHVANDACNASQEWFEMLATHKSKLHRSSEKIDASHLFFKPNCLFHHANSVLKLRFIFNFNSN